MLSNKALADINYNYHAAMRWSLIVIEDGILIYCEPLVGCESHAKLRLVPRELHNILFVAFILTLLVAILMHIVPYTASVSTAIGQGCGHT